MLQNALRDFLRLESAGGIVLVAAAALALAVANSPAAALYEGLLDMQMSVQAGPVGIAKPVLLWINDGLMAVFFLVVGLEIKRELVDGELSRPARVMLPAWAAFGGMAMPTAIFVLLNGSDPVALNGWAIPAATDIAFALGVLSLFGSRVPVGLKVFLLTVAVLDDLGAIVIIAVMYTAGLSFTALALALVALAVLVGLNAAGVTRTAAYVLVGVCLWVFVLKSGVHATLAGVALGLAMPMSGGPEAPGKRLEHALHPWVAFGILPLFAFANAGVPLAGIAAGDLLQPLPLGIAAGLFLGKQIGVFGFSALAHAVGLGRKPEDAGWGAIYGVGLLSGIGFTMSLFIASLAFEHAAVEYSAQVRLGILLGSLLSALCGYVVLRSALPKAQPGIG